MNVTTIKDIGDMTGGDPILAMRVTVKNAYPPKGGQNEYGPWTVQNATLEDETGTIKGGFFNATQDLRNFTGGQVTIKSGKDLKGKFSGIAVYDYENKKTGAVERQLKVSEHATFDEVVGGSGETGEAGKYPAPSQPAVQGSKRVAFTEDADQKRESIERQKALSEAVMFAGGWDQSPDPKMLVGIAEIFYQFLSGKESTPSVPIPVDSSESEQVL